MKVLTVFLCLSFYSLAAIAQTYRWVDENGVVSYSQTPPPSQEAETLTIKPQSQIDNTAARKKLDDLRQQLEDQREDRQLAQEELEKTRQERIRQETNCRTARDNLRKLEGLGNRLLRTADGDYKRLTEEERLQRIQATIERIKHDCHQ
ncbi:MAG: DUF4124 domain-containing protein [Gammaproteobacteria bacterium]|nr:DUF4124 domain-containing protein [Gammaproteobacteria bacterium]